MQTRQPFAALLAAFADAVQTNDGQALARLFVTRWRL
jgi:hypothetical protein